MASPTLVSWSNSLGATLTLATAVLLASPSVAPGTAPSFAPSPVVASAPVFLPGGGRGLVDATGVGVPLSDYCRVVGAGIVASRLVAELAAPGCIVALTESVPPEVRMDRRLAGVRRLSRLDNLERVLELEPDLVVTNSVGDLQTLSRLRNLGVRVFELGEMHGLGSLIPSIHAVAALVGRSARGAALARDFVAELEAVAKDLSQSDRREALYLGVHGDKLYGATRGTSLHDVLGYAGLVDAAAARFRGWPRYTTEQLLLLDPEVIVTQTGMRQMLCRGAGLSALRACGPRGCVVELDEALAMNPGLPMLQAAVQLREAVYGSDEK
jgi:iron complex transport system substrate-binding protein